MWDIGSWNWPLTTVKSRHEYDLSQIGTCADMTLDIARTCSNNRQNKPPNYIPSHWSAYPSTYRSAHVVLTYLCVYLPAYIYAYIRTCLCTYLKCVWGVRTACAYFGNGTCRRTATMAEPLLLTSGPVKYEAVLHTCGTNPVRLVLTCDRV